MAKAKRTLIDKHIEEFINNNFDKKDRKKDENKQFEWFVNSMHVWHTSSQLYSSNKNIGKQISLGDAQGGDAFYISVNNNEKLYTLNDNLDDIMTFLKQNGKTITFYFIQTKKTESINWASFLNLIDVPLTIWKGNEFPKSQPYLKKIQDFIDEVTDEGLKISHKIAILFYTNKNINDIEQLKNDWSVNINNKKTELAEYFSKSNIEIEFRGSDFLNDTYEKMMSNDYELSISRNEVIATEDKHYLVGYFTAKELLDAIAPINNSKRVLYPDVFKNNIRLYLGQTDINKGIEKTLLDEPQNFHLYNNGITITTKEIRDDNSKNYIISPVNIVNGCQTANSIYNVSSNPHFDASIIKIPVKVIVAQDEVYETITIRSNTQTGIEAQDLVSIKRTQKELQDIFSKIHFNGKKFYYKRQKSGAVENADDVDYVIEIDDILRAIFSSLMLIPNKVSGYFDQTIIKYLDNVFDEQFIDIYVRVTVLLKFIDDYLEENDNDNIRLKYHILYIMYRIILPEEESRRNIEQYLKSIDDRAMLFSEKSLEQIISQISNRLYALVSNYSNFERLIKYVESCFRKNYPVFFNITDKKAERILYKNVEQLKRVRVFSLDNFESVFNKSFDEIIKC